MFDLDDLFDPTTPEGIVFAVGSGLLDDDHTCGCDCGCTRSAVWPDDMCEPCRDGRHRDPFDDENRR